MPPDPSRRVLIVEDDREMREMLSRAVASAGFEVVTAGDGREAGAVLDADGALHLIVLDLVLPEVGGFAVLARLGSDPRRSRVPVMVVTGEFDRAHDLQGVAAIVHKPFEPSQISRLARTHALPA